MSSDSACAQCIAKCEDIERRLLEFRGAHQQSEAVRIDCDKLIQYYTYMAQQYMRVDRSTEEKSQRDIRVIRLAQVHQPPTVSAETQRLWNLHLLSATHPSSAYLVRANSKTCHF